jgi:pSer/pThr/pTyr-binding forkhead associated (FHA) protein
MKLELINTDQHRPPILLAEFPVIVGLDPDADVCLDDSSVGHYQCMIDFSDGELTVWDLGTKLGTSINGVRVDKKATLRSGDRLTVGRNHFAVQCDGDETPLPHSAERSISDGSTRRRPPTGHRRQPALPA